MHTGSCLCGAVTFEVDGELPGPDGCHCTQCRKWSGHFLAGTDVPRSALRVRGQEHVTWYHSSGKVRRGFCSVCGSSLFFDPLDRDRNDWTGVAMGAFDTPTNTRLRLHIFTAEKGDYYEITDDLPRNEY
jgi:hypothetical protein